jgi:hypothetical protein
MHHRQHSRERLDIGVRVTCCAISSGGGVRLEGR